MHRIVIIDLEGGFVDQVGGNGPALLDGSFETAALNRPQGVAYSPRRECLYVADTENNALREVRRGCCRVHLLL
jgi:sugar lactone lactonase YvrE